MRTTKRSNQFKRDQKRELKGKHSKTLVSELNLILELLENDQPLPPKYNDHSLTGNLKGFRDCHVVGDKILLLYSTEQDGILWLARLGSHSEIGLNK